MSVQPIDASKRAIVADDAVLIHDLLIASPDVVQAATSYVDRTGHQDVAPLVEAFLEIGAKATALGSSTVDVDAIKRSLEQFTSQVTTTAKSSIGDIRQAVDQATDVENGTIARTVATALQGLARDVNAVVAGEDAPVRTAIEKTVKTVTDKTLEEVQRALSAHSDSVRRVLSTDSPDSPLNTLKLELLRSERETREDLKAGLSELKTLVEVTQQHRATMEKTAIKGMDFEKAVMVPLDELAHGAGDTAEATGATVGSIPRCKNGDAVITLSSSTARGHTVRIAVEAKDMTLTAARWREQLDAARKNRDAVASLGIAKTIDHMPGGKRILILDPLHIVVAYDPEQDDLTVLYAVYHLLRAQAACVILDGTDHELDLTALQEQITKSIEALEDFDKVDRCTSAAIRQVQDAAKACTKIRSTLGGHLAKAVEILEDGQATSG